MIPMTTIGLFAITPLLAMELLDINKKEESAELSYENLIPNKFEIYENTHFTTYSATHELYPESHFHEKNKHAIINTTDYVTFEPDGYLPGLFHLAIKNPSNTQVLISDTESHITSFALSRDKQEIAVGRDDGVITIFNLSDGSYYDRNCSLSGQICSVSFSDTEMIIGTDDKGKVYLLNKKTHVLISISSNGTALKCPSYNPEQILIVQGYNLELSGELPLKFFYHNFTPEQHRILSQCAQIKQNITQKKDVDYAVIQELNKAIQMNDFEPLAKKELEYRLPKSKKPVLSKLQNQVTHCFQKLQQCYTEWKQPVAQSTGDTL